MGYADLHIHTIYSVDGTASPRTILKYAAHHTDLDVIAITDHDEIRGALEACDLASKYAIQVIPGIEITSRDGHILALWVEENIPAGLSATETIYRIGNQGGLAIAAHPMARGAHGLSAEEIHKLLSHPDLAQVLVGIETYNAGLIYTRDSNRKAQQLAEKLPVAQLANSDAHTPWMIGGGQTKFNGTTSRELRFALQHRLTRPVIQKDLPSPVILLDWLALYTLRLAGFVIENHAPETGISFVRCTYPQPDLRNFFEPNYRASY
jgi:predicted metal-dependent phosphoesterase TrpH